MEIYSKVIDRIGYLTHSDNPEEDIKLLVCLQKEENPGLSDDEALNYAVLGLVKYHRDHKLDFLWMNYLNDCKEHSEVAVA